MSTSKKIVKNTFLLYVRMFLIMGVSLYTSRIVLIELGVNDFGIYSLVGGIVSMLGFFNASMSAATQRYLSYDIGVGNEEKLKKTFSSALTIHIIIAILLLILAETLGLWYIHNRMIFPIERVNAVSILYQFSIFTFLLGIIQVPYNSLILAREKMNVFAYMSIFEIMLKLIIVFLLNSFGNDKLVTYSILTFIVALIIRVFYQIYCRLNFKESKFSLIFDKDYIKELLEYSGWNLFGSLAAVSRVQGNNIVLNLFFGTTINAAYGIMMQVQSAILMFVSNFQLALNPQIIQNYASQNFEKSSNLVMRGAKFSFFLMMMIIVPICFSMNFILEKWLKEFPSNTIVFVQLALIGILIDSISGPLMTIVQATGKIKVYQIIIGTILILNLPVNFLLLNIIQDPSIIFISIILFNFLALFTRMLFLKNIPGFDVKKFLRDYLLKMGFVFFTLILIVLFLYKKTGTSENWMELILNTSGIILLSLILIWSLGLKKEERFFLKNIFYNFYEKYNKKNPR
ncbi:MATE family efflux transporter [Sphingobacterium endophyticum]|uniref:MATE family efflux transporter n=1 Tax=Sphingobacterium endophyticum TaxID=2546448 RepID=UPI0012E13CBE|nr:MATE family efflux transporter [Sphingobacterium endophyticum]